MHKIRDFALVWLVGTAFNCSGQKLSVSSYNFSSTHVGATSAPQPIIFTATSALTGLSVSSPGGPFAETNNCQVSLSTGDTCTVNVTFTPSTAGAAPPATITVSYTPAGAAVSTQQISLNGQGATLDHFQFSVDPSSSFSVGAQSAVVVTAIDTSKGIMTTYTASALVKGTDLSATFAPLSQQVSFNSGSGTFSVIFSTPGTQTLTITDATANITSSVTVSVITNVSGCSSCYATIGAGAVVSANIPDYNNVQNVLEITHLGRSTPQYSVGLGYKLPWRWPKTSQRCPASEFNNPTSEARAAYCFPFKAFVSLKFASDSSNAFTGFVFGFSHAIHTSLDGLFGLSYSPYNGISPGFRQVAVNTYVTQTKAGNPCYAQFNLGDLQASRYDGFPTQLVANTAAVGATPVCTPGAQIYSGSPLVVSYHPGFFIGVALPIQFKQFFGGK